MRLTPRQLRTTHPHPLVTMVRCMAPYNPWLYLGGVFKMFLMVALETQQSDSW